ncbi:MAG TPA: FAD-dependent oxidoreductase [Roseiflexaceae bacterium]|nr:FAD-dependent oxidoreductase [Roseiflexaceae bacterium]
MRTLNERPVWLEGVSFPVGDPAPPPERVDVAVIGGGYTGLAAARALARGGARVALLEAQTLGWGASTRNGGMVLTGLKLDVPALAARYGPERARRLFLASLAAIDCVEQLVAEERIDCDFARCGHLVVASRSAHARALAEEAALLGQMFGHRAHFLPPSELPREIGAAGYHGGLVDELSAGVQPARYAAGLVLAARRAGALLYEHTPVRAVVRPPGGAGFLLDTPHGRVRADAVLVATGAYTGASTPDLRRRLLSFGSYIIATAPLPAPLAHSLIPHGRMVFDTLHLLHYYRLTPDRRMLFGGRARFVPATPRTTRASAAILRAEMVALFPQLRDVPVEYAWGGQLDVPFDMMPHIGQRGDLHYALGYAGHGVAMGTYLGDRAAARILGQQPADVWDGLPFPAAPPLLYPLLPLGLPLVGLWHRMLDRFEF